MLKVCSKVRASSQFDSTSGSQRGVLKSWLTIELLPEKSSSLKMRSRARSPQILANDIIEINEKQTSVYDKKIEYISNNTGKFRPYTWVLNMI